MRWLLRHKLELVIVGPFVIVGLVALVHWAIARDANAMPKRRICHELAGAYCSGREQLCGIDASSCAAAFVQSCCAADDSCGVEVEVDASRLDACAYRLRKPPHALCADDPDGAWPAECRGVYRER